MKARGKVYELDGDVEAARPLPEPAPLSFIPFFLIVDVVVWFVTLTWQTIAGGPVYIAAVLMAVYFSVSYALLLYQEILWTQRLLRVDRRYFTGAAAIAQLIYIRLRERIVVSGLFYVYWALDTSPLRNTNWVGIVLEQSPLQVGISLWSTATLVITGVGFALPLPRHSALTGLIGFVNTTSDLFWLVIAGFIFAIVYEYIRRQKRKRREMFE